MLRGTRLPTLFALLAAAGMPTWAGEIGPGTERPAEAALGEQVEFLRLRRDEAGGLTSLETSIVEYVESPEKAARAGRKPVSVDLVAAVHLGSKDYYQTLDRLFAEYDAVLYELVAPPESRVPRPGGGGAGALGSAQQGLTKLLGLQFQLDAVDYTAENFVHADLSPKEFEAAMRKRGESWWTMFTKLMRESMARAEKGDAGSGSDLGVSDVFSLMFGSQEVRQLRLRRLMAEQLSDMEVLTATFGGEDGSTLITDRNAAALNVLRRQMDRGKRRIAIFYGAAHMDDFDQRLREDFSFQPGETVWLEAWDLRQPAPRDRPAPRK